MTSPIMDFILDRLAVDEERATRALGAASPTTSLNGEWEVRTGQEWQWDVVDSTGRDVVYLQPGEGGGAVTRQVAEHIAGHDPARVLAEVRLKRWLLAGHEAQQSAAPRPCCSVGDPCALLLTIASVYQYQRQPDPVAP